MINVVQIWSKTGMSNMAYGPDLALKGPPSGPWAKGQI